MFKGPDELWAACCEYFEWNAANPLYEVKAFAYEGIVTQEPIPKMRAMTIAALCQFLDVSEQSWRMWRQERSDLLAVITRVDGMIYRQKFEGASADLLNANIIARDLGLANKTEMSGPGGGPIQTEDVTRDADAFARRVAMLAARHAGEGNGEPDAGSEGAA